jgi:pimeloyl-ACP methyl ester carboxylesterase
MHILRNLMVILAVISLAPASGADTGPPPVNPTARTRETVVLLHGLARTERCMKPMSKALTAAGYTVYILNYPTTEKNIKRLTDEHLAPLLERCQMEKPRKIHFVAHSLGNIVLRQYFATRKLENAGRIVMLGPPNQGSEVVDRLGGLAVFDWINGPAGQQLGTGAASMPRVLPPPPLETGVIAGTHSINWILSCLIPGPDDGKVALEHTKFEGMRDFIAVPVSHPFLMSNRKTIRLTLYFLEHGRFPAAPAPPAP